MGTFSCQNIGATLGISSCCFKNSQTSQKSWMVLILQNISYGSRWLMELKKSHNTGLGTIGYTGSLGIYW